MSSHDFEERLRKYGYTMTETCIPCPNYLMCKLKQLMTTPSWSWCHVCGSKQLKFAVHTDVFGEAGDSHWYTSRAASTANARKGERAVWSIVPDECPRFPQSAGPNCKTCYGCREGAQRGVRLNGSGFATKE